MTTARAVTTAAASLMGHDVDLDQLRWLVETCDRLGFPGSSTVTVDSVGTPSILVCAPADDVLGPAAGA